MKYRVLTIVLIAALLFGCSALAENAILAVQGTGMVSLDPDTATIQLGVREASKHVNLAQAAVNAKVAKVVAKLKGMGVQDKDIHTSSISIYEDYGNSSSSMGTRYFAENTLSVTIRDIENAGKYIDAVFAAGANTFSGISFSASDTEAAKKRALELSVENARKKADVLAAAAGMRIAGIKSVTEQGAGFNGDYYNRNSYDVMMEKAEEDAETQVFSEQIQVSATVTVEYTMVPVE